MHSRVYIERFSGTLIDFLGRLERFVVLKYHTSGFLCLLHGSPHGIRA